MPRASAERPGTAGKAERSRREEKKEQTRERLLDAAADVFARRGFQAASLDEIAERAGLTKGAVYSNFAGKDDLIVALLEARLDPQFSGIVTSVDPAGDLHQQATEAARAYLGVLDRTRESYLLSMEFVVHLARHPELRRKFAGRYRALHRSYARMLEEYAAKAGFTLPLPAEQMIVIYMAMIDGLALTRLVQPEAVPDELFVRALELLDAHLGPPEGT